MHRTVVDHDVEAPLTDQVEAVADLPLPHHLLARRNAHFFRRPGELFHYRLRKRREDRIPPQEFELFAGDPSSVVDRVQGGPDREDEQGK